MKKIFFIAFLYQPASKVGDSIKISFDIDLEEVIDISIFENTNLKSSMKSK